MLFEKTHSYLNSTKMPSINCTPAATVTTTPLTSFKVGEPVNNSPFLQLADAYAVYADNFDLSLLPQDCNNPTENIPTTVYQYSNCSNNRLTTLTPQEPPQIKIEQTWSKQPVEEIKQELNLTLSYEQLHRHQQQQQFSKTPNQLIPPQAYPQLYPSPQSSPAQSEYAFSRTQYAGSYDSLSSSHTSPYPSSPCSSLDISCIKQELHILPPSPPESNCEAPSPHSACSDVKTEPFESESEAWIDLNTLFDKSGINYNESNCQNLPNFSPSTKLAPSVTISKQRDHQLLREYLEDTSLQQKNNIKPLALDSFIGGLEAVRGDIEPVISLALEHAKREVDEICAKLQISQDPSAWSTKQVHAWLRSTIVQFDLPPINDLESKFYEDGAALVLLSDEEFTRRVPESGSTLHAQLDIWKMAFTDRCQEQPQNVEHSHNNVETITDNSTIWETNCIPNLMDLGEESDEEEVESLLPTTNASTTLNVAPTNVAPGAKRTGPGGRSGGSHIHLWQFLKELLSSPNVNGTAIRWIDRNKGIFKIEDSVRVAKLWGRRKNRPAMNYDKLSRSIRQYYKKGIMKKTERSQRLVYQFCHPYHL